MKILITLITLLVIQTNNVKADVLIIDRIQKSGDINTPKRGESMNQVLAEFGEPALRKDAIGDPPIIVWKYADFTVYFENTWVINSVVNKSSPEEKGPKPANQ